MKWTDIDDEYAISFVFVGNFRKRLVKLNEDGKVIKDLP